MKTPFPYQVEGAEWLPQPMVPGQRGRILGDAPGLGKTIQAIRAADHAGAQHILVVCPAIARPHWQREFREEQHTPRSIERVETAYDARSLADVLVVSWNLLSDRLVMARLMSRSWDVLILDEAHAAKNPAAKRTQAVYGPECDAADGLASRAGQVWALTGTPILNGPHEVWPHYRALFPVATKRILSYPEWMEKTCLLINGTYGLKVLGAKPEARDRLKEVLGAFILRRRKADVLADMPPLTVGDVTLGITIREQNDISGEVLKLGVEDSTIATAVDQGVAVEGFNLASLASLLRMLGEAKAEPAARLLMDALLGGVEKAVVFFKHRSVGERLAAALGAFGVVKVDGATPPAQRQTDIDAFQRDPECRVFLGQIDACSTAITLTAASDVYLVEYAWVPAINGQAIQRCHRIGQTRPVVARFLSAEGTVDELVGRVLARKAETLEALGLEDV